MSTDLSILRRLARTPMFRRWAIANLFARLPLTMNLLALVLVGEHLSGSLAVGAQLAGAATLAAGLSAQWRGRSLDRVELRSGLRRHLLTSAAVTAVLTAAVIAGLPVWAIAVLAVAEGMAFAAVLGGFRALLVPAVEREDLEAANALDAVFVEVAFVAGPALAGALALLVGAQGVLVIMTVAMVVAAGLVGRLPERPAAPPERRTARPPWAIEGMTSTYALALGAGVMLGSLEASIPARLQELGRDPALAGPLLALTAAGSGLAGVVASVQRGALARVRWQAAVLFSLLGALYVVPAAATGVLGLAIGLFVLGVPIAPLNALGSLVVQDLVPEDRQAEGFALFTAVILIGAGLGQALSGQLLPVLGPQGVFVADAALGLSLGALVLATAVRRSVTGQPLRVGGARP